VALKKSTRIQSRKIREAARGEDCTFRIPGVCNGNPETTVLAHLPDESHGMARKSDDISAAFACSACHDAIDRRHLVESFPREWYMRRAMIRTWRRLIEKGVIRV